MADGAFGVSELDWDAARRLLADAAHGADDAEICSSRTADPRASPGTTAG